MVNYICFFIFIWNLALLQSHCTPSLNFKQFGNINGLNKFFSGNVDANLFFDTPTNFVYQTKKWDGIEMMNRFSLKLLSNRSVYLDRVCSGMGMHKEVVTKFYIKSSAKPHLEKCFVMLSESISSSFYIDIYENERLSAHHLYYNSTIDIEKTAYQSINHTILIFKDLVFNGSHLEATYKQNWHVRYHQPSSSKYVNLKILSPEVYLFCKNGKPAVQSDINNHLSSLVVAPCPWKKEKRLCVWGKLMKLDQKVLTVSWPVGILMHSRIVSFFTICVTSIGTLYLTYRIFLQSML